jgi:transcriptional regulator with XRE-family HTH domain
LESKGQQRVTPAYITRIEQYDEIPSPEFICRIADVFKYDLQKLLELAKNIKVKKFGKRLQKRYDKAEALYRKQK